MNKSISGFNNYEISREGIVINLNTGNKVPSHNGKVRLYDRPKHKVTLLVSDLIEQNFTKNEEKPKNGRNGMSDKIRSLYKSGLSRKEVSQKIMPNQGYVDNVIYKMNFKDNKDKIIEDLKTMSPEDVQNKHDVAMRFINQLES